MDKTNPWAGEREEVVNCFSVDSKNQDKASLETAGCHDMVTNIYMKW